MITGTNTLIYISELMIVERKEKFKLIINEIILDLFYYLVDIKQILNY